MCGPPVSSFLRLGQRLLPHLLGHLRVLDPLAVAVVAALAVALGELLLDHLELLAEHGLAVRLADLVGDLLRHLDPETDVLSNPDQELEEGDVPLPDRVDLEERLLLLEVDRHERHDEPHDLVDRVHPVDRLRELLGAGEPAADLVDGQFYVREDPVFRSGSRSRTSGTGSNMAKNWPSFSVTVVARTLRTTCAQTR